MRALHMVRASRTPGDSVHAFQTSARAHVAGILALTLLILASLLPRPALAEDGYDLWLRYRPIPEAEAAAYRARVAQLVAPAATPAQQATRDELVRGWAACSAPCRRWPMPPAWKAR